jgi:hypothetical protein
MQSLGPKEPPRRQSTPRIVGTVVRLHHQLFWAQARTSTGRKALYFAGSIIGMSLWLLLCLTGSAAALFSALLGNGEETARWIFTGIWINGASLTLVLGRGAPGASLSAALKRYPMTRMGRLCAKHVPALFSPIWLFLSGTVAGVAAGFAVAAPARIPLALAVALVFTGICYLSSLVLLSVAEFILSVRGGGTIVGVTLFVLFAGAGILTAATTEPANASWWRGADLALRYLPPGAAASLLAGARGPDTLLDAATLLLWCGFLAAALNAAGRWSLRERPVTAISNSIGIAVESVANLSGPSHGPLVAKALRYLMRCDRVRLGLAGTLPLVLLLPQLMGRGGGPYRTFLETTALIFLSSILATASMTLNHFGYDGDGVRRYWLLPVPAMSALRAAGAASLVLGGALILACVALLSILASFPLDARSVSILASSAVAGLLLFNSAGLWTSVLSPRRGSFRGLIGNELSFGATLALGVSIALVLAAAFLVEDLIPCSQFLDSWWAWLLLPIPGAALYVISLRSISRFFTARREVLARQVSGPDRP